MPGQQANVEISIWRFPWLHEHDCFLSCRRLVKNNYMWY